MPTPLLQLNQQISLVQDVLIRYRRRARARAALIVTASALLVAVVALWFYSPAELRASLVGAAVLLLAVAISCLIVVLRSRVPTDTERDFLGLPAEGALTLPDLDLEYSRLREERRSHPELGSIDHKSQYQDDISFYVEELRARGIRSRRANNVVQIVTIVGSLAATGVGALALGVEIVQWVVPVLTFVVGAASAIAAIYKFKDRSFYAQQTANAIDQEVSAYHLGIGRYKNDESDGGAEKLRALFLEEIHRLKTEQENREQNLDQPAQRSTENE